MPIYFQNPAPGAGPGTRQAMRERNLRLFGRWLAGETQVELARSLRVSPSRVHQLIRRASWELWPWTWGPRPDFRDPCWGYLCELWWAADESEREVWGVLRGRLPLRPGNIMELL